VEFKDFFFAKRLGLKALNVLSYDKFSAVYTLFLEELSEIWACLVTGLNSSTWNFLGLFLLESNHPAALSFDYDILSAALG